jgi:hypothetical protein
VTGSVNESMVRLENGVGLGMLLIDVCFGVLLRLLYIVESEVPPGSYTHSSAYINLRTRVNLYSISVHLEREETRSRQKYIAV